jgi:hypothetical protein
MHDCRLSVHTTLLYLVTFVTCQLILAAFYIMAAAQQGLLWQYMIRLLLIATYDL